MTKKLPEKFTNIYPRDPDASSQEKINEIIDYLTPEAPTEEVTGHARIVLNKEGDTIESNRVPPTDTFEADKAKFGQKSQQQINIEYNKLFFGDTKEGADTLTPFCSNCGKFHKKSEQCVFLDITPTQSTLDEVVEKIDKIVHRYMEKSYDREAGALRYNKEDIKQLLSPYIQDKPISNKLGLGESPCLWNFKVVTKEVYDMLQEAYGKGKQEEYEGITLEEAEEQIKQCTGLDIQISTPSSEKYSCFSCGGKFNTATECHIHKCTPTPQATEQLKEDKINTDFYKKYKVNPRVHCTHCKKSASILIGHNCNPQATSVDVEKVATLLYSLIQSNQKDTIKEFKEILSSLPIVQKKRTEDEVECYRNLDSTEDEVRHTTQFLRAYNLISD